MRDLFFPSSVAVIGVSTHPLNLGKEIAGNLLEFKYTGEIHLVGVDGGILFGRRIHKSVGEIPDPIDLAIILTPAKTVPDILEQCGRKGIRRAIIETGGFGEYDQSGQSLGEKLKHTANRFGMRFIGPNCIGIMNASNGLAAPFARLKNVFRRGGVGIIAQSGGMALTYLNLFDSEQLGFSKFAAIGNKLNVDENDVLEYYVEDPETSVICMYLESIEDGRRMTEIARRSAKPIVVHKANVSSLSSSVAQSHTQALANDDRVVDAALSQAGMVRFRDISSYVDFVKILQLPRMKGRNLAIVSRSGGHAVIGADAAHAHGFRLPPFQESFLAEIRKHLRADVIRLANPLDLGDLFDFEVYVTIIEHTLKQETVDGILFLHTYFAAVEGAPSRKLLQTAASLSTKYGKPCAMCVMSEQSELSRLHEEFDFPIFLCPERTVQALDRSIKYQQRREFIASGHRLATPNPPADDDSLSTLIGNLGREGRSPLLHEALDIMKLAGLALPGYRVIDEPEFAEEAFKDLAGPYAVKVIAAGVSHKSDQGGVVLHVADKEAARGVVREMVDRFGGAGDAGFHGCLVQKMVSRRPGTYELIVGGKRDPQFGPMVLVGAGGIFVEIFGQASLRMAPLSLEEIEEMIDELPGAEILKGFRGIPPVNRESLKDAIVRIAHLMVNYPTIDQIDVNPILVSSAGTTVVDARVFLKA